jgi:predicted DCC family thiol-disulfide oxidoreductase YuxK
MNSNPIIVFDGICSLCNSAVIFIIKRDKKSIIKFVAFQTEKGKEILQQFNLTSQSNHSIVFIEKGEAYTQSTATLKICKHLTAGWPLMYGFIIVPTFIRNGIYQLIAKNRYHWFGKKEKCMVPSQALSEHFL